MWKIFNVKTELEIQIQEYVEWKANFSEFTAQAHKQVLFDFSKFLKTHKTIQEIKVPDLELFFKEIYKQKTPYNRIKTMQAIKGFIRYYHSKKLISIHPNQIDDDGIYELQNVRRTDIIPTMIKRRPGRPANIEFIKKVKRLIDKEGMSISAVARAEKMSKSNIHFKYHYDLTNQS